MTDIHGAERIIELNSSLIRLSGNPIGIIMILRDITVKHKIDNEINKMSKLESIGILAGGIAHDFNNLLTGISGNISIAKNTDNISEEIREIIEDIEKATERATALTKQLLTFASGGAPLITPSSIEELLRESVKLLIKDPLVQYSLIIDEYISPVLIDPNQISQAVNNLLINSLQAMPDGGKIVIEAKNAESVPVELNPDKNYVYIRISDNGPGIDKKNQKKIFDPFYTTKTAGTGLGLTSTYSIIKKHKGHIQVISSHGEGASFEIYLPASENIPEKLQQINKKDSKNIKKGSILIMDDEEYILQVFVKMLKHLGFTVDCAKNGEEAIKLYKEKFNEGLKYSYVILDLTIPGGMGGKTAITEMKKIDPDINAIVSSGYSENPVMANYQKHGFKGILKKPYTL
jgi:nitrogen-specific signal transduction histidine kinase/CheY-like chemotaxis protein